MAKKKRPAPKTDHSKLDFPKGASLKEGAPRRPEDGRAHDGPEGADLYRLKHQAVEDLVTANKENSPPVSKQELRKYHAGPKKRVPDAVKAILLKVWFAGVICYFFIWGLSTLSINQWDLLLVLSVALGAVTFLITKNIYRFIAKKEGDFDRWMMFPGESILWLPADLVYAVILVLCTVMTYNGVNRLIAGPSGDTAVGVEPILFGIFVTLWDLIFLGAKYLMKKIVEDAKNSVSRKH